LLRVTLAHGAGVRPATAAWTGGYETLAMMASGAMLAAIVVVLQVGGDRNLLWGALGLMTVAIIPILPGVFNFLVKRVSARFGSTESMSRLGAGTLLAGLLLTALCWVFFGASLSTVLAALQPDRLAWSPDRWLHCTAAVAVSYVAGFVSPVPGGLGVREI